MTLYCQLDRLALMPVETRKAMWLVKSRRFAGETPKWVIWYKYWNEKGWLKQL